MLAGSSFAATITWDNNLSPAAVGVVNFGLTTKSFLDNTNTFSLAANSLNITNMPNTYTVPIAPTTTTAFNLGQKRDAGVGAEHGLGIMTQGDAEIRNGAALHLDLSAFVLGSVTLTVDSIDAPSEGFRIWRSATANGAMTLLTSSKYASGGVVQSKTFNNPTYKYF
jgi:hypothetical protein